MQIATFGRRMQLAALILSALALVATLCARLLSLLPNAWFTLLMPGIVIALAVVFALLFPRRPAPANVARAVDERAQSKELFLTATLIGQASGEYRGIVLTQAEERASQLDAARLFPLRWRSGARNVALALAALTAGVLWLPKCDPFKMDEQRNELAKQEARLAETRKITAIRREELKEKGGALTEQVDQALAKLDRTFKEAKPQERELNAKKLNEEAQDFSELWKKVAAQVPKDALEKAAQHFGDSQQRQAMKELLDKLRKGDAEGLKQAMEKLRQQMQEIAKQPDGAEKKQRLEKLAKELGQMANQMREQLGDKALNEALARAAEQLGMAKDKGLSKDALDAANQSLSLSQDELKRLAEMFKDAQNLEDALKNLAAAKQLNDQGKLDGKDAQFAGANSQQDYQKLYDEAMRRLAETGEDGDGDGKGNGKGGRGKSGPNPGIGQGGTVGEDDSTASNFKKEKDKVQLSAGRLLMEWKEEGVGDTGKKAGDYNNAVRAVRQGVAEAIRNEQVPPGYHGAIQKYFDNLPEKKP
jgi:O-acetyl-ADP-ribose deacetylase (regulator of RNase III)